MVVACFTDNEAERLRELESYQIMDTEPDAEFDKIVEEAAKVCEVPIALFTLVDETRQWFKARVGLKVSETPRDVSFCGHVILGEEMVEIPDTYQDVRFYDNPLVTDYPFIRFYAGQPIVSPNGFTMGTLCVIDIKPKYLNQDQKKALKLLAEKVERLMVSKKEKIE